MQDTKTISVAEAEKLLFSAFVSAGVEDTAAQSTAKALAAAEAEGQVGHGFSRLDDYVAQVKTGKINASAKIQSTRPSKTAISTDADYGFAYPALDKAIELGIETAHEYGSSSMSVFNSHHCGVLSIQVEKLANAGLIGFMFTNSPKAIAPWGSGEPIFGTNPIAFAAPRKNKEPLVIDLSLSKVARGKVMNAKKSGKDIPDDWALDKEGNSTTSAEAALQGSMLPIGDAKGTSLALMVEIMVTAFAGGLFSKDASSFFEAEGPSPSIGQFLIAINPGENSEAFLTRLEELLSTIEALEGARLPGMRRQKQRAKSLNEGISVPVQYLQTAERLASGSV